jgi:hypothetical protein
MSPVDTKKHSDVIAAINKWSDTDYAWAAGFIEAEGCFFSYRNGGNSYCIRIDVAQVNKRPIDKLQAMFGGQVEQRPAVKMSRPYWRWHVQSKAGVIACLDAIDPYLVSKRDQSALLREIAMLVADKGGPSGRSKDELAELRERRRALAEQLKNAKKAVGDAS